MAKTCAFTVVSADGFEFFIPLWIYSIKRAYPEWNVKVLIRGKLLPKVAKILEMDAFQNTGGWEVIEDQFLNYKNGKGTCGACRLLIPRVYLKEYKFAYITDVDFVVFRHSPTHLQYHSHVMKEAGVPYSAFRGPSTRPWRPKIHESHGWRDHYMRICGGTVMIRVKDWLRAVKKQRALYKQVAAGQRRDGIDKHRFGSYREYDEVMHCRMLRGSGLKVPKHKNEMPNGKKVNASYRDIHLGDFKFTRRLKEGRRNRLITQTAVKRYKRLWKDPEWCAIAKACTEGNKSVRRLIRNSKKAIC